MILFTLKASSGVLVVQRENLQKKLDVQTVIKSYAQRQEDQENE